MTQRTDAMLGVLIVFVLVLDAFVGFQVYQQRTAASAPALSLPSVTTAEPGAAVTETTLQEGAVAQAESAKARSEVQAAVLAAQLAFTDTQAMPADSFALQTMVPGPRFVDGVARAGIGVIGVDRTDTTILFVTAEADDRWICASVDGGSQATQYGQGPSLEAVGNLGSCLGSQDGWS